MTETMTTEDALQLSLDAEPSNHTLRMVLADYLDEVGDPRAEGYRVLGELRRIPEPIKMINWMNAPQPQILFAWGSWFNPNSLRESWKEEHEAMLLPGLWMNRILTRHVDDFDYHEGMDDGYACWRSFDTRREADDAAALAWLELTESEKIAVLENPMSGT